MTNEAVVPITSTSKQWLGQWEKLESVVWIDNYILLVSYNIFTKT